MVNSSLDQGEFCDNWKEALVKSLIKKKELGTQNSNNRPVSNLSFISKIVEENHTRPSSMNIVLNTD